MQEPHVNNGMNLKSQKQQMMEADFSVNSGSAQEIDADQGAPARLQKGAACFAQLKMEVAVNGVSSSLEQVQPKVLTRPRPMHHKTSQYSAVCFAPSVLVLSEAMVHW